MSSLPNSNTPVDNVTEMVPPVSSACAAATESNSRSAGLSSFTASPSSGPTVRKFGTSSKLSTSDSSVPYSSTSTLSSSSTRPSGGLGAPEGRKTSARARGWRTLMPASARALRPSEVRLRATSMDTSSAASRRAGSPTGQSTKCTDAVSSSSKSSEYSRSLRNGQNGASSSVTR